MGQFSIGKFTKREKTGFQQIQYDRVQNARYSPRRAFAGIMIEYRISIIQLHTLITRGKSDVLLEKNTLEVPQTRVKVRGAR